MRYTYSLSKGTPPVSLTPVDRQRLYSWLNIEQITLPAECFEVSREAAHLCIDDLVRRRVTQEMHSRRRQFSDNLDSILQSRFSTSNHVVSFEALLLMYEPGDYTEAARFLWDR